MTVHPELLAVRLKYIRDERARERRYRRGLRPSRSRFLEGLCEALRAEIEAAGMAHVRAALPPGIEREIACAFATLSAAGLGFGGLPVRHEEVPVFTTQLAPLLAPCDSDAQRTAVIQRAVVATFDFVAHGPVLCLWPQWLPLSVGRAAAAHLSHHVSQRAARSPEVPDGSR